MEKAYIILAHKNPAQVQRLINALADDHTTIFLHIDKNANATEFKNKIRFHRNVVIVKSESTPRGSFGLVQATLNSIKAVLSHNKEFDYTFLISGQHYPIKSTEYIHNYLLGSKYGIYLEYTKIPDYERWEPRGGLYRVDKYFFGLDAHQRYSAKAVNFLTSTLKVFQRKFHDGFIPYGGSQWWILDNYALKFIMHFLKNNEDFLNFYKYSFAPDELLFHNILLNAKDDIIQSSIVNNNLLYMNWPSTHKGHPELLQVADFRSIAESNALFARKFDIDYDSAILDLIDEHKSYGNKNKKAGVNFK